MNGYKKIFKDQEKRFGILKRLSFVPDRIMIKIQYFIKLKRFLDLEDPKLFTEKVQYYKLKERNPKMQIVVDKFEVRHFLKEKNYGDILVPIYDVLQEPEELYSYQLPPKCVIKATHASGTNVIMDGTENVSKDQLVSTFKNWFKRDMYIAGREWAYKELKPKIIIEQYLENDGKAIDDYKFFCFHGVPTYVGVNVEKDSSDYKRIFYNVKWERQEWLEAADISIYEDDLEKPINFEYMIKIAEDLSKDFPFVRVDLYNIEGKIYFGEMTFYPWSGYMKFKDRHADFLLGRNWKINV